MTRSIRTGLIQRLARRPALALLAALAAMTLPAAGTAAQTDLKVARFAWVSGKGCGTGPRAETYSGKRVW